MADAIRFQATIYKVQTLVDGGLRATLDLSEQDLKAATDLMECKLRGALLEIAAVPIDLQKDNNAISERAERKSSWTPAEETSTN